MLNIEQYDQFKTAANFIHTLNVYEVVSNNDAKNVLNQITEFIINKEAKLHNVNEFNKKDKKRMSF